MKINNKNIKSTNLYKENHQDLDPHDLRDEKKGVTRIKQKAKQITQESKQRYIEIERTE